MGRSNKSAKSAGASFERAVANYLRDNLGNYLSEAIDKQPKMGAKDHGDIANVRDSYKRKIVVECKDYGGRLQPPQWLREAAVETDNAMAYAGVVVAKRKGTTNPGEQFVLMDVDTLIRLLQGVAE